MLRFFRTLCLLLLAAPPLLAQQRVRMEDVVKPGSRLIYGVESRGMEYDFIVTIQHPSGAGGFRWQMTAPVNLSGQVVHRSRALQSANRMYNFFDGGLETLDDNTLSVWISRLACQTLLRMASPFLMYLHGDDRPPTTMAAAAPPGELEVIVNGRPASIREQLVKPQQQPANAAVGSLPTDFFSFYPSLAMPIILRMDVGFYIALKEIRT